MVIPDGQIKKKLCLYIVWVFGSGTQKMNMTFVTPPDGYGVVVTAPRKCVSFVSGTFEGEGSSGDKETRRQLKFGEEAVQTGSVKMVKTKSHVNYDDDDDVPLAVLDALKRKKVVLVRVCRAR